MTPTTPERSTMIAVFTNRDQANQAIDNLRHAGYSYDHIRLVERGANSFIENLKSLFTGQAATSTNSADDWMRIGVPEQDAHSYQSELDAGRSIVLIKAVENPEQALGILRQSGAYDIASRLRTAQSATASGASNSNAQPGAYNPNAVPGTSSPNAQPGTYDATQPQPRQSSTRDERSASV
jgi:cell division septation protein DedD